MSAYRLASHTNHANYVGRPIAKPSVAFYPLVNLQRLTYLARMTVQFAMRALTSWLSSPRETFRTERNRTLPLPLSIMRCIPG